jgi:hypothetical protein
MARQANTIVAQTFGWDAAEMREYRYQDTRTGKLAIYTIGNNYFTVSKTKPTWDDLVGRNTLTSSGPSKATL